MGARRIAKVKSGWKSNFNVRSNGCWEWKFGQSDGYGMVYDDLTKRMERVHRMTFKLFYGEIPAYKEVLHKCDNRLCGNPRHVRAGTHVENVQEAWLRSIDRKAHSKASSAALRKLWRDPKFRARNIRATKKRNRKVMLARWRNPKTRKLMLQQRRSK